MRGWIEDALRLQGSPPVAVCVRMMGREEIAGLNQRYRSKPTPTNVLSFPGEGEDEAGRKVLGDIALCVDVVADESKGQGKSLAAHTAHMLVHGVLHLEGYDHLEDEEAREMERLEVRILGTFGFEDPYVAPGESGGDHE